MINHIDMKERERERERERHPHTTWNVMIIFKRRRRRERENNRGENLPPLLPPPPPPPPPFQSTNQCAIRGVGFSRILGTTGDAEMPPPSDSYGVALNRFI